MAIGDVWECRLISQFLEQVSETVLHYRVISNVGGGGVSANNVAGLVGTELGVAYKACMTSDATFLGTVATKIHPIRSQPVFNNTFAGVGTFGDDAGARQVSGVIRKIGDIGGRHGRGRSFIPFPTSDAMRVTDGKPSDDYMTALGALALLYDNTINVVTGGTTEDLAMIIYRRAAVTSSALLIEATAIRRWGTQRRRGDYGIPNVPPS